MPECLYNRNSRCGKLLKPTLLKTGTSGMAAFPVAMRGSNSCGRAWALRARLSRRLVFAGVPHPQPRAQIVTAASGNSENCTPLHHGTQAAEGWLPIVFNHFLANSQRDSKHVFRPYAFIRQLSLCKPHFQQRLMCSIFSSTIGKVLTSIGGIHRD